MDALLRRRGLLAVIGVRLIPVLPFTAINYAAGLTAVGTRDYVMGTAVGIVPGTVAWVALGSYGTEPASWPFAAAVAALVLLSAGGAAPGPALEEIKDVLDLQRGGEQPCARVTGLLDAHIAGIDRKLADLHRLRRSLLAARRAAGIARRDGRDAVVCQIIENAPAPDEPVRA